ncbi:hypothetical protein PISMIDRAFT_680414 [Pisolithus microcarpus 441]|uniref:Unplaced genomic scaffold scaffold_56, whole genome shotgun sequence n=1 Tax=Pisolithus microcarpus 441 TaxID=765257 RepID=A0A0C9ZRL0_9AGAM|nr:hypothetical protein PISMIDRAFT_680414 [Pisolithus microcarpus 441]
MPAGTPVPEVNEAARRTQVSECPGRNDLGQNGKTRLPRWFCRVRVPPPITPTYFSSSSESLVVYQLVMSQASTCVPGTTGTEPSLTPPWSVVPHHSEDAVLETFSRSPISITPWQGSGTRRLSSSLSTPLTRLVSGQFNHLPFCFLDGDRCLHAPPSLTIFHEYFRET